MTPEDFKAKWEKAALKESAGAKEHFVVVGTPFCLGCQV